MTRLTSLLLLPLLASLTLGCVGVIDGEPEDPQTVGEGSDDVTPTTPKLLPAGKIAVVFAHGLGGTADSFDTSIVAAIEADGHVVERTTVPAVEGVAARAAALGPQLDALLAQTGATKVHVIAHSMGGLDTRYLISKLGYGSKIASLTTISTPHRGSPLADLALGLVGDEAAQQDALDAIIEVVGQVDPEALKRALSDLAVANAPAFNAKYPDDAAVKYFSYAGLSTPSAISNSNATAECAPATAPDPASTRALLLLAQPIVANGTDRIPNDAVVAVSSAKWGTFAGCIPSDHLGEPGPATAVLDTPAFYKAIVAKLALL